MSKNAFRNSTSRSSADVRYSTNRAGDAAWIRGFLSSSVNMSVESGERSAEFFLVGEDVPVSLLVRLGVWGPSVPPVVSCRAYANLLNVLLLPNFRSASLDFDRSGGVGRLDGLRSTRGVDALRLRAGEFIMDMEEPADVAWRGDDGLDVITVFVRLDGTDGTWLWGAVGGSPERADAAWRNISLDFSGLEEISTDIVMGPF